jgi:hypothetical protein
MGPIDLGGGRTTGRLRGPGGGRFTRQGCWANRSRRRQSDREAIRSRRQVHREGVWGQ